MQADHVSGLLELAARTGATAYPWVVLTGDALLVGDAGRPDLHAHGEQTADDMARTLYRSLESAGYDGVAVAAALSGLLAASFAVRDVLVVAGAVIAITALVLAVLFVRDTADHVALEQGQHAQAERRAAHAWQRVRARKLPRARAARLLAGRPGQQPQRRARLGPRAASPPSPRPQGSGSSPTCPQPPSAPCAIDGSAQRNLVMPR